MNKLQQIEEPKPIMRICMSSMMQLWSLYFGEIGGENREDGYYSLFKDEHGLVQGHVKAVAGGLYWDYPQQLMDLVVELSKESNHEFLSDYVWELKVKGK